MNLIDHLFAVALVFVWPVLGTRAYRRFIGSLETGRAGARLRQYQATIIEEWALVAGLLSIWFAAGRDLASLGLTVGPSSRWLVGGALTVLVLGLLVAQGWALRSLTPASKARIRAQLGEAAPLLPVTDREYRMFQALAVTAGICEEILFRGFLIWYAGSWLGPWGAVAATAVAFGLGHAYQGGRGVLKTGTVGLFMGALYLLSGSLFGPMVIHIAVDLQGGALGRAALRADDTGNPGPPA